MAQTTREIRTVAGAQSATAPASLRATDDERGIVAGYATTWDEPYRIGPRQYEIMRRGAFEDSLAENPTVAAFYAHAHVDHRAPIGQAEVWEDYKGLRFRAQLWTDASEEAERVYRAVKSDALREVSVGFTALETDDVDRRTIEVTRAKLYEISFVLVGAARDEDGTPFTSIDEVREAERAHRRSRTAARRKLKRLVREAAKREPSGDPRQAVYRLMKRGGREFRELVRNARS